MMSSSSVFGRKPGLECLTNFELNNGLKLLVGKSHRHDIGQLCPWLASLASPRSSLNDLGPFTLILSVFLLFMSGSISVTIHETNQHVKTWWVEWFFFGCCLDFFPPIWVSIDAGQNGLENEFISIFLFQSLHLERTRTLIKMIEPLCINTSHESTFEMPK